MVFCRSNSKHRDLGKKFKHPVRRQGAAKIFCRGDAKVSTYAQVAGFVTSVSPQPRQSTNLHTPNSTPSPARQYQHQHLSPSKNMPPIRTATTGSRTRKPPPPGFEDLEDTLLEFSNKMKDAQTSPHEGKKRHEALWPIHQISHQRSRYVFDLYYTKAAISRALYEYLLKNGYADAALIAKWKKQGYEKLCCVRCIQTKETNFSSTCICRVPKATLGKGEGEEEERLEPEGGGEGVRVVKGGGKVIQCVNCGCRGCASAD
jgi:bud site selection protein 31